LSDPVAFDSVDPGCLYLIL